MVLSGRSSAWCLRKIAKRLSERWWRWFVRGSKAGRLVRLAMPVTDQRARMAARRVELRAMELVQMVARQ